MAQSSVLEIPLDDDLLKVLSSESRREIMRALTERRMTGTELASRLSLGKPAVSEHLKKLHECGLVERHDDTERRWVYFSLTQRGKDILEPKRTRFILMLAITVGALMLGLAAGMALYGLADGGGPIGLDATPTAATSPDGSQYPAGSYVVVKRDDVDLESGTINGPYQVVEGAGGVPAAAPSSAPEATPSPADSSTPSNSPEPTATAEPAAAESPATAQTPAEPAATSSGGFQQPFDPATLPANLTTSNHTVLATPTLEPRPQSGPVQTPGSNPQSVEASPAINASTDATNTTSPAPTGNTATEPAICSMTQGLATITIACPVGGTGVTPATPRTTVNETQPANATAAPAANSTASTVAAQPNSTAPKSAPNATTNATASDPAQLEPAANLTLPATNLTTSRPAAAPTPTPVRDVSPEIPAATSANPSLEQPAAEEASPEAAEEPFVAPEPTHEPSAATAAPVDDPQPSESRTDSERAAGADDVRVAEAAQPAASTTPASDATLLPVAAMALALLASLVLVRRRS